MKGKRISKGLAKDRNALKSVLRNVQPMQIWRADIKVNMKFLIGLARIFIMIFIFKHSGQIWIDFLQNVMRYNLFVEERYNISRITKNKIHTHTKMIYLHFVETLVHTSHS